MNIARAYVSQKIYNEIKEMKQGKTPNPLAGVPLILSKWVTDEQGFILQMSDGTLVVPKKEKE